MANRVAEVNRELKRLGHEERLVRGKGYYYFWEGDAPNWWSSSVPVYRADVMSVSQWLDTMRERRDNMENLLRGTTCKACLMERKGEGR